MPYVLCNHRTRDTIYHWVDFLAFKNYRILQDYNLILDYFINLMIYLNPHVETEQFNRTRTVKNN